MKAVHAFEILGSSYTVMQCYFPGEQKLKMFFFLWFCAHSNKTVFVLFVVKMESLTFMGP